MSYFPQRHAIARAEFFLALAENCDVQNRQDFEAFIEAAIIFARTAIHRLKTQFEHHPDWSLWFASIKEDPAVCFFRHQRDFILKEASPKMGQVISFNPVSLATNLYYFETPSIDAATTVRKYIQSLATTIIEAENRFSS